MYSSYADSVARAPPVLETSGSSCTTIVPKDRSLQKERDKGLCKLSISSSRSRVLMSHSCRADVAFRRVWSRGSCRACSLVVVVLIRRALAYSCERMYWHGSAACEAVYGPECKGPVSTDSIIKAHASTPPGCDQHESYGVLRDGCQERSTSRLHRGLRCFWPLAGTP